MHYYPSSAKTEFYRDTGIETAPDNIEVYLLSQMPKEDLVWYCNMLTVMGDTLTSSVQRLLIAAGVKLKIAARPSTFSQETL